MSCEFALQTRYNMLPCSSLGHAVYQRTPGGPKHVPKPHRLHARQRGFHDSQLLYETASGAGQIMQITKPPFSSKTSAWTVTTVLVQAPCSAAIHATHAGGSWDSYLLVLLLTGRQQSQLPCTCSLIGIGSVTGVVASPNTITGSREATAIRVHSSV